MYRELVKCAIKRTHDELQTKATAAAQEKKAARSSKAPADPLTAAKRERDAQLRELTDQAHGANLDLGVALMNGLAAVDSSDIDVARFFVLCRRPHRTNYADGPAMRTAGRRAPGGAVVGGLLGVAMCSLVGIVSRGCRGRRGPGRWACSGLASRWVGSAARARVP